MILDPWGPLCYNPPLNGGVLLLDDRADNFHDCIHYPLFKGSLDH